MPSTYLISLIAFLAVLSLVVPVGHWLGPRGWMDVPSGRKQHTQPIPRVGGVVLLLLLLTFKLLGWLSLGLSTLEWSLVFGLGTMGVLDDRFNLRAKWKSLIGLLLALPLAVVHTQLLLQAGSPVTLFGMGIPNNAGVFFSLLTMWYWAVPQAFNLIDGLNGLLLGFSCILLAVLSLGPASLFGSGSAPLLGMLVALLLFNYPRARHFMGDSGSLSLGMLFAILVMDRALPVHRGLAFWVLAYPILDVTTVVVIRLATGKNVGHADRSHLHHWMLDHMRGHAQLAVPLLLALATLPMLRDLSWEYAKPVSSVGLVLLIALCIRVFLTRVFLEKKTRPMLREDISLEAALSPSGTNKTMRD